MNGWLTLLYKEFRMIRTSVLLQLGVIIIGGLWLVYLSQRHPGIILAPAALLAMIALFYPVLFMFKNVSFELKHTPQLWLHCPQPAWLLLAAKLIMSLAYMLAILLLAAVFVYWVLFSSYTPEMTGLATETVASFITEAGTYTALFVLGAGIYMASWGTLIAVVSALARGFLGRFHWLAALAAFFAATWGMGRLRESWIYNKLTHWGAFDVSLRSLRDQALPIHAHFNHAQIYTGELVFYTILTVALFALAAWLIDHRVEV